MNNFSRFAQLNTELVFMAMIPMFSIINFVLHAREQGLVIGLGCTKNYVKGSDLPQLSSNRLPLEKSVALPILQFLP